ncbi:hypothetical protein [Micromonospora sp. NPDC023956]|uniref:hypothetical protein n=1 Tax=Micromonospora sp. NPDC023956 TaxID=3155722 RepID=UPI0033D85D11
MTTSTNTPAEPDTDAILAALDAAGLTVTGQQIEADSIDIHLDHRSHPDYAATALSWRPDGQGWYLLPVDPDDDAEGVLPDYLGLNTPAYIAEAITEADFTVTVTAESTPAKPDTTPDLTAYVPLTGPVALLRDAVITMATRYGTSCMKQGMARSDNEQYAKADRAATRQFAALQRLTRALAEAAQDGTR